MKNFKFKHAVYIFLIGLFIYIASSSDSEDKKEEPKVEKTAAEISQELTEQLKLEIASIDTFNNEKYSGSVEMLMAENLVFTYLSDLIKRGEEDTLNVELAEELSKKLIKLQTKEYPIMRGKYIELLSDKMWEHDISVKSSTRDNSIINITGAIFAANRNKKDFIEGLGNIREELRIKEIRFRWYEGESEYTFYDLPVKNDNEI